jgi:hypothetical protein
MSDGLDWIEVYAEARVAFPADVSLRTEDDLGRVKITAYRHEWNPPLPPGMERLAVRPGKPSVLFSDHGEHRERIYALSFMVDDERTAPWLVKRAARQWAEPRAG